MAMLNGPMLTAEMLALSVAPMCVTFAQRTQTNLLHHCGSRSTAQSWAVLHRHPQTKKVTDKDTWAHLCMGTWLGHAEILGLWRLGGALSVAHFSAKCSEATASPTRGRRWRDNGETPFCGSCIFFLQVVLNLDFFTLFFFFPAFWKIQVLRMLACNGLQLCILSEKQLPWWLSKVRAVEFERAGQNRWFLRLLQAWIWWTGCNYMQLNSFERFYMPFEMLSPLLITYWYLMIFASWIQACVRKTFWRAGMQRCDWLVKLCAFLAPVLGPTRELQVNESRRIIRWM